MVEVLSLPQAARRFRVTAKWLKEQVKAGTVPHLKAGQRFLFNPTALGEALSKMASEYPRNVEEVVNAAE